MKSADAARFAQALAAMGEMYDKPVSNTFAKLYFEDLAEYEADDVLRAMSLHRRDPDRGRFFPTPADMEYQLRGDRNQAKISASEAFDLDPLIDGTRKFEADRETYEQRDRRKRAYIASAAHQFGGHSGDPERPILPGIRRGLIGGGKRGTH